METTEAAVPAAEEAVAAEATFTHPPAETATAAEVSDSKKSLAFCVGIWYDLSCENKCISWKECKDRGLP